MRQDVERSRRRRSLPPPKRFAQAGRIVQTLNLPHLENKLSWQLGVGGEKCYVSWSSPAEALLDDSFGHPAGMASGICSGIAWTH